MSKLSDQIGQFITIPVSVVKAIPQIGKDAFVLFSYLRFRTNSRSGKAFPSFDKIQEDTGLVRRKIAAALRSLESAGFVTRKRRFGASTIYTLIVPKRIKAPISNTVVTNENAPISNTVGTIISNPVVTLSRSTVSRSKRKEDADKPRPDPILSLPEVIAYRNTLKRTPNDMQRQAIANAGIKDLTLWQSVLDAWRLHSWNPGSVPKMLNAYQAGGVKNGDTRKPAQPEPPKATRIYT